MVAHWSVCVGGVVNNKRAGGGGMGGARGPSRRGRFHVGPPCVTGIGRASMRPCLLPCTGGEAAGGRRVESSSTTRLRRKSRRGRRQR